MYGVRILQYQKFSWFAFEGFANSHWEMFSKAIGQLLGTTERV
jgi:hypothetical protein